MKYLLGLGLTSFSMTSVSAFCIDSSHVLLQTSTICTTRVPTQLYAKQKRRPKKKKQKQKISTERDEELSTAANREMASLAGVSENHNFEQFFYSDKSTKTIYQLVRNFEKPLLMCNPSLAVMADADGIDYLLLDRDTRFDFLKNYREFSLLEPFLVNYDYDAIFIDPPFANVTPSQLVQCIQLMSRKEKWSAPVFIAYNAQRENELVEAFKDLNCPGLTKLWRLEYSSVSQDDMNICLFGPNSL